ncbi:hypothetical protein F183_A54580 (plasmid) [Bryobacterales bacterium F-183]|nr:hypothetical protein F183_A54580 [Bryobacterales bacterium F-183]
MGFAEETNASPLGLAFIAIMALLMLGLPRRWAFAPLVMTACWMTLGQKIVLGGINLPALRLIVAATFLRLLVRGEFRLIRTMPIDWVVIGTVLVNASAYVLLWQTQEALINRLGMVFNVLGMYLGFRSFVQNLEDVERVVKTVAWVLLPVAALMTVEQFTGRNLFAVLGGVPAMTVSRAGRLRCQGPFSHPILAGTFGAVWLPMFLGLYWWGKSKLAGIAGVLAATAMTVTSGSSGPVMTYMVGIVALGLWPIRHQMKLFRWGVVGLLVVMQIVMNKPVWFIFARINILSGSTGWHRSHLIDMAVEHLSEWVLLGIKSAKAWRVHAGDITNHYLLEGLRGGLLAMVLFIWGMVWGFRYVGRTVRAYRLTNPSDREMRFVWSLGAMIAAHMMTFFSVAYFEPQSLMNWYLTLALAVALFLSNPMTRPQAMSRGAMNNGEDRRKFRRFGEAVAEPEREPEPEPELVTAAGPSPAGTERVWWGQARSGLASAETPERA